jgi:hypothetical protein
MITVLKRVWFWTLVTGLAVGGLIGYNLGLIRGYDQAITALRTILSR